jgi:hypothetical protein
MEYLPRNNWFEIKQYFTPRLPRIMVIDRRQFVNFARRIFRKHNFRPRRIGMTYLLCQGEQVLRNLPTIFEMLMANDTHNATICPVLEELLHYIYIK